MRNNPIKTNISKKYNWFYKEIINIIPIISIISIPIILIAMKPNQSHK